MTSPPGDQPGSESNPQTAQPKTTQASVGGIGAGTGLVALAQLLGPGTTWGAILIYLSPAVSVASGAVLYYMQVQVYRWFEKRVVANAKKTLEGYLKNDLTSPEHKAEIRGKLEDMEKEVANHELERVRLVGIPPRNQDPRQDTGKADT